MKYRELGKAKVKVSAIGLGCQPFIGNYGPVEEATAISIIHRAIDLGVTLFDTAGTYGRGQNEEWVGRALKGKRDKVVLETKFGNLRGQPGEGGRLYDGRPEYVPVACEESLKRLRTDVIDIYYLHRVDPEVPIEDTVGAMARLVEAGKVRHLGLSEAGPETLRRASKVHPITALQSEYSVWVRDYEKETIPACRELGIGFVAYYAMGRGFLSGKLRTLEGLEATDTRLRVPRLQEENIGHNLELLDRLNEVAGAKGCTLAQLVLAWILHQGDDLVPIPGMTEMAYLEENILAPDVALNADDLARIDAIFPLDGGAKGLRYKGDRSDKNR
jgi:aryl-alcohol dehydrogenase-like predicted oxidoreductase